MQAPAKQRRGLAAAPLTGKRMMDVDSVGLAVDLSLASMPHTGVRRANYLSNCLTTGRTFFCGVLSGCI